MRNFFLFSLVLALVICGVIVLGHESRGLTAPSDVAIERVANMTSGESFDSNAVEVDGIRFETIVSEPILTIPANKPDAYTPVQIGLRITNQTPTPIRFSRFGTIFPELLGVNGQPLQQHGGIAMALKSEDPACRVAKSGESVTFFHQGLLSWRNNKLLLGGYDSLGYGWYYSDLKPDKYQFRILYYSQHYKTGGICGEGSETTILDVWAGQAITPLVELHLVQP